MLLREECTENDLRTASSFYADGAISSLRMLGGLSSWWEENGQMIIGKNSIVK